MALEKVEDSLEKVAMGNHEREKAGINKVRALPCPDTSRARTFAPARKCQKIQQRS